MDSEKTRSARKSALSVCIFGLLFCVICGTVTVLHAVRTASGGVPTLFYNDTAWAQDDVSPSMLFVTGSTDDYWIPLSFFETIDNIKVRRGLSKTITFFVISDTETGKYLSFDTNSEHNYVQTERGTFLMIQTIFFSKERYLPMRDLCAYFGWSFEQSEDRNTVRITDGGERLSMEELLSLYQPEETETTVPDETQEPGTDLPGPDWEDYRASAVYLTFEDINETAAPAILDTLLEYDTTATFFVTGEQISAYPSLIIRMLAEGHTVGLHTMTGKESDLTDTEALFASLSGENDLLYALTKRKSRLVRLPEGSHSGVLYLTERQKKLLADEGYILWDWNISAMDHDPSYDADAVYQKILNGMESIYIPVIRFHCTETAAAVLPSLLSLIAEVPRLESFRITDATVPVVFP